VESIQLTARPYSLPATTAGQGSPLLFLHGYEGHPGQARFLDLLAVSRKVVAPEQIGFGKSHGFENVHDIFDVALAYRELLEQVGGGQPVDVVGHSFGGMMAAEAAAVSPHLVRKLVLVNAFGLWLDEAQVPDFFVMTPDELSAATFSDPSHEAAAKVSSLTQDGLEPGEVMIARTHNLSVAAKFMWPIPDRGLSRRLPYVKAPTLLLWGQDDKLAPPPYAEAFRNLLPNAQVRLIAGAGHYPQLEKPDEFARAVTEFLG
jgi:pimeloyl-ACP methyl ester carboxylesterase